MLFLLTLVLFGICLVAVFVAHRSQLAQERRRALEQGHHLASPSGRPLPVPGDVTRGELRRLPAIGPSGAPARGSPAPQERSEAAMSADLTPDGERVR